MAAGALEYGARAACAGPAPRRRACGDGALHARALAALGTALVHAVRGRDEEGAAVLHQALAVAEAAGDRASLVNALRELAYIDIQAGRRAGVEARLARAEQLAEGDAEHAAILAVQGMNHSDMGDYPRAFAALEEPSSAPSARGDRRRPAFSLSLLARAQLLRGETDDAPRSLDRALALVEAERWLAFLPFPEALRGEVDLRRGRDRSAPRSASSAPTRSPASSATRAGRACRRATSGCCTDARGQRQRARGWIDEARARCTRLPDRYVWMQGHVLDTRDRARARLGRGRRRRRSSSGPSARSRRGPRCANWSSAASPTPPRIGQAGALDSARVLAGRDREPALETLLVSA